MHTTPLAKYYLRLLEMDEDGEGERELWWWTEEEGGDVPEEGEEEAENESINSGNSRR